MNIIRRYITTLYDRYHRHLHGLWKNRQVAERTILVSDILFSPKVHVSENIRT
jgi:hypothetical protein